LSLAARSVRLPPLARGGILLSRRCRLGFSFQLCFYSAGFPKYVTGVTLRGEGLHKALSRVLLHQRAAMASNLEVFLRGDDSYTDLGTVCGNRAAVRAVGSWINRNPQHI